MRAQRTLGVVMAGVVASAALVLAAGPALASGGGAATSPSVVAPAVVAAATCGYNQVCTGAAQPVPVGTEEELVTFACSVVTPYAVQATGVSCHIQGLYYNDAFAAPDVWLNGPAAATGTVTLLVPQQPYKVCVGAGFIGLNGVPNAIANQRCGSPL